MVVPLIYICSSVFIRASVVSYVTFVLHIHAEWTFFLSQ